VSPARILVVSNGYAEDVGASAVIRALPRDGIAVTAYPLVGLGRHFPPDVRLLDPRRDFPSRGFGLRAGWGSFRLDLAQGYIRFWRAQHRTLHAQRGRVDLVAAFGDVYCLWMASACRAPTVFLAAPKSEYIAPHSRLELWLIRRLACDVLTRDEFTASALARQGIPAAYLGFWMRDAMTFTDEPFGLAADRSVVTVLAGSKPPAFQNIVLLLRAVDLAASFLPSPPPAVLVAWAPELPSDRLRETVSASGGIWTGEWRFRFGRVDVTVAAHHYPDALRRAAVVVGMAGGANEQAASLGKPVVAFPGTGPQFTPRFLEEQQRLLGEALVATPHWQDAARALARLLGDRGERERRGRAGAERLGGAGATVAIAQRLLARLSDLRLSA
jgi:uncharacterized protein (TIGR03492 family)